MNWIPLRAPAACSLRMSFHLVSTTLGSSFKCETNAQGLAIIDLGLWADSYDSRWLHPGPSLAGQRFRQTARAVRFIGC